MLAPKRPDLSTRIRELESDLARLTEQKRQLLYALRSHHDWRKRDTESYDGCMLQTMSDRLLAGEDDDG